MKAQFNQMLDEQICKISSYESRVNKAKANYTKALQRLEELNSKIYDTSTCELSTAEEEYLPFSGSATSSQTTAHNGASVFEGEAVTGSEFCPQHHKPVEVSVTPENDVVVETSENDKEEVRTTSTTDAKVTPTTSTTTATASTTDPRSGAVFKGCQVLDELLLEDNIESTLEQLKSQCLS